MLRGFFDKKVVNEVKEHPVYVEQKGWFDELRRFCTDGAIASAFISLATGLGTTATFTALTATEGAGAVTNLIQSFTHDDTAKLIDFATSAAAAIGAVQVAGFIDEYVPPPYLFAFALVMQTLKNANAAINGQGQGQGQKRAFATVTAGLRAIQSWDVIQGLIFGSDTKPLMWLGAVGSVGQMISTAIQDCLACKNSAGYVQIQVP